MFYTFSPGPLLLLLRFIYFFQCVRLNFIITPFYLFWPFISIKLGKTSNLLQFVSQCLQSWNLFIGLKDFSGLSPLCPSLSPPSTLHEQRAQLIHFPRLRHLPFFPFPALVFHMLTVVSSIRKTNVNFITLCMAFLYIAYSNVYSSFLFFAAPTSCCR